LIHLDTNFLIRSLVHGSEQGLRLNQWLNAGESVNLSAIAFTEFLCGPVSGEQLQIAARLFPHPEPFESKDSQLAADLFNQTGRRRGTLIDCMIAAIAIRAQASLATANLSDFRHFTLLGLRLQS
jgi:predicted nucleic acid-binding protein